MFPTGHAMRLALLASLALASPAPAAAALASGGTGAPAEGAPAGAKGAEGEAPARAPPAPAAAPAPAPSLDFDLLGEARRPGPAPSPELQRMVDRRRTMLSLHQGLGIATWASVAATAIVGQLDFDDRFRGGGDTGRYHRWHRGLAAGSGALFLATGLLAVLAPEPYPKKLRLDTATLHKAAMGVAAAGMVAQVVLGLAARSRAGSLSERRLAEAHQVVGYTTLGAVTAGGLVLLF